jgi:hypothetical protein
MTMLLRAMKSRREMRLNGRKGPDGFWLFTHHRVRSTIDYVRIVEFKRCPARQKAIAQGKLDRMVQEARRYSDVGDGGHV